MKVAIVALGLLFTSACQDGLNYDYLHENAALDCSEDDEECLQNKIKSKIYNYTEELQWNRKHYQTLSLKFAMLDDSYEGGSSVLEANGLEVEVVSFDLGISGYKSLASSDNFKGLFQYGDNVLSLETIVLKDFDVFSSARVASFADGSIEKDGFIGGLNVYSNPVVHNGDSSLVSGFNSIVSY